MCVSRFIHSFVSGHLECSHVLAVINSAAVNIGVHVSFRLSVFVIFGCVLRLELLGHMVVFFFFFNNCWYNVVPISPVQQNDLVIQIYIYIYIYIYILIFNVLFYHGLSQKIGYGSLYSLVGSCCWSIINVIVAFTHHRLSVYPALPPPP